MEIVDIEILLVDQSLVGLILLLDVFLDCEFLVQKHLLQLHLGILQMLDPLYE